MNRRCQSKHLTARRVHHVLTLCNAWFSGFWVYGRWLGLGSWRTGEQGAVTCRCNGEWTATGVDGRCKTMLDGERITVSETNQARAAIYFTTWGGPNCTNNPAPCRAVVAALARRAPSRHIKTRPGHTTQEIGQRKPSKSLCTIQVGGSVQAVRRSARPASWVCRCPHCNSRYMRSSKLSIPKC